MEGIDMRVFLVRVCNVRSRPVRSWKGVTCVPDPFRVYSWSGCNVRSRPVPRSRPEGIDMRSRPVPGVFLVRVQRLSDNPFWEFRVRHPAVNEGTISVYHFIPYKKKKISLSPSTVRT